MVASVQAPNRASPPPAAAGGAAGLVALLGRGLGAGAGAGTGQGAGGGLGDGFAELVAETRSLSAISGAAKDNARPRAASAEARDRNLENFAARLQRDIDRLKARNQGGERQGYSGFVERSARTEKRRRARSLPESGIAGIAGVAGIAGIERIAGLGRAQICQTIAAERCTARAAEPGREAGIARPAGADYGEPRPLDRRGLPDRWGWSGGRWCEFNRIYRAIRRR